MNPLWQELPASPAPLPSLAAPPSEQYLEATPATHISPHSAPVPAFDDSLKSTMPAFGDSLQSTMPEEHIPHDDIIAAFGNFGEFLDWGFSGSVHAFQHDQHGALQQEHVYYHDDHGDKERLAEMWENWLHLTSEPQTLDSVFGMWLSACISTSPDFSSQTSANFLPNGDASHPAVINTSIPPLLLSSTTSPNVANEHNLSSLYENDHVNGHLHTDMASLMGPYPSALETNLMAPLSPPRIDVKATTWKPMSCLKAKTSCHKMKTAGVTKNFRNDGVKKNEEAQTCLVESTADGYVWHKYGEKNIKNRMHPRAYFKCAHPNCPVKKQTELSSDMQGLVSITYFGEHNHSHPPPHQIFASIKKSNKSWKA